MKNKTTTTLTLAQIKSFRALRLAAVTDADAMCDLLAIVEILAPRFRGRADAIDAAHKGLRLDAAPRARRRHSHPVDVLVLLAFGRPVADAVCGRGVRSDADLSATRDARRVTPRAHHIQPIGSKRSPASRMTSISCASPATCEPHRLIVCPPCCGRCRSDGRHWRTLRPLDLTHRSTAGDFVGRQSRRG